MRRTTIVRLGIEPEAYAPVTDPKAPIVFRATKLTLAPMSWVLDQAVERLEDSPAHRRIKETKIPSRPRRDHVPPLGAHVRSIRFASSAVMPPSRRYSCQASAASP